MNRCAKTVLLFTALLAAAAMAAAQTAEAGFNVQELIMRLSLYLPEDMAQPQGTRTQNAQPPGAAEPRPQLEYTRDPKLYLTRDQTSRLIPVLQGLRENPLPSPSKARKIESDVAAILTAAQKAEFVKYQKALEKLRQSPGPAGGAQVPNLQNMTDAERQEFINSLPEDQRQRFQQRGQGGAGGARLSQTERRQRQVEEFIQVLQNWEKKAK
jgi:hypothetical protein